MTKLPLIVGLVLLLASCAEVKDREGSYVDLYPIEYSLGFDLQKVGQKQAEKQLDQFIEQYWSLIVSQPVSLNASGPKGKKLALVAQTNLLKRGAEAENILLKEQNNITPYDFEISITKYRLGIQDCPYHSIYTNSQSASGCYIERLRWTSMIRPERMLIENGLAGSK